jgi:hypothetical protein
MHAVGRNDVDNERALQIDDGFHKDSQDSGNHVADAHREIQQYARG